jgi:hypothetical protein
MDNREIARALGRSDGATKVLIHRAIKQLEELVGETGRQEEEEKEEEERVIRVDPQVDPHASANGRPGPGRPGLERSRPEARSRAPRR